MPRSRPPSRPPASHRRSRSRQRRSPSPHRSRSRSRSRTRTRARTQSSSARSKSADSHSDKKGAVLKTSLVFLGSIAAATYAAHKLWPKGVIHGEREDWEVEHEVQHVHRRRARSRGEYRDDDCCREEMESYRRQKARWEEGERHTAGRIAGGRESVRRGEDEYERESGELVEKRRPRRQDGEGYDRDRGYQSPRLVEGGWSARPGFERRENDRSYRDERPRQLEYDQGNAQDRLRAARRSSADWEQERDRRW